MSTIFKPAAREQTSLLIAIAGSSGSGKTYSALKLATGLADGGKIAFIDTEAGRGLHYADQFKFDHAEIKAPFKPETYIEAIQAADKAGYKVIIIDSMSHEYEGEGGLLDWAADLEASGTKSPANWKEPKQAHKRMMSRLLQCRAHLIFCLRAEEKMLLKQEPQFEPDGAPRMWKGKQVTKTVVIASSDRPLLERWAPLCEKRFMYEITLSLLMLPDQPGIPHPIKLQEQHLGAFPVDALVNEECGKKLAAWAKGGRPINPVQDARDAASLGRASLQAWWRIADNDTRKIVNPFMDELKKIATAADPAPGNGDSFGLPPVDQDPAGVIPDAERREAYATGFDDASKGKPLNSDEFEAEYLKNSYRAGYQAGEKAKREE